MKSGLKNLKLFHIGFFIYLICLISNIICGLKFGSKNLIFFNQSINFQSLCGIFAVGCIAGCLIIVYSNYQQGLFISLVFLALSFTTVCLSILLRKQFSALPGFFMDLSAVPLMIVLARQLKKIHEEERKLETLSITDPLTGLYNQRGLKNMLSEFITKNQPFYLLFLDLDNFKIVNDNIGHRAGDIILTRLACQWQTVIDKDCIFARNGGDEFVILVPDTPKNSITKFMTRCLAVLKEEIYFENYDYYYSPSASIGAAHFPNNSRDMDDLLKFADIAMYSAKASGGSSYCFYSKEMQEDLENKLAMESVIRDGLSKDRFYLAFQPQYDAKTKKLHGFEVLLRLTDENGKKISPAQIIPIAERSNLIFDIDNWVLSHAIIEGSRLLEQCADKDITISINISARHILERNFVEKIKNCLALTDFDPRHIEIEITEYCLVSSLESAAQAIKAVQELGIKIALDDFGTGYASIKYLTALPFNVLKIDKSFIDNLSANKESHKFVSMIISVGHSLGCILIAEGVETEEQFEVLKNLGCDCIQGYLLGKPIEFDEAKKLIPISK